MKTVDNKNTLSCVGIDDEFTRFLNTLCCNQCIYLLMTNCTHDKSEKHDADKVKLEKAYEKGYVEGWQKTPPPVSKAREGMLNGFKTRSENINEYFVCTDYKYKNA